LTCARLGRHAVLADIREVMEAALEKAVVPAGDVKNRHVDLVGLVADVELTPVSVVLGVVEVILEVRNGILQQLDPIVNRKAAVMFFFQASPKAYRLGIRIIIPDRLEQMLSAVSL